MARAIYFKPIEAVYHSSAVRETYMSYCKELCKGTPIPYPERWMYRVMQNDCTDYLRSKMKKSDEIFENASDTLDVLTTGTLENSPVERQVLEMAIMRIKNKKHRKTAFEAYINRTPHDEIAEELDYASADTVNSTLIRIKRKLKQHIDDLRQEHNR